MDRRSRSSRQRGRPVQAGRAGIPDATRCACPILLHSQRTPSARSFGIGGTTVHAGRLRSAGREARDQANRLLRKGFPGCARRAPRRYWLRVRATGIPRTGLSHGTPSEGSLRVVRTRQAGREVAGHDQGSGTTGTPESGPSDKGKTADLATHRVESNWSIDGCQRVRNPRGGSDAAATGVSTIRARERRDFATARPRPVPVSS